jgi:hypothetical protein
VAFGPVWRGIADALRTPRLAAPLYLANVLAAMVPASLGLALFGRLAGERPWASELIGPEWGDQVVEVAAATVAEGRLAGGAERVLPTMLAAGGPSIGLVFPLLALAAVLQGLAYAFFSGGVLERLAHGAEARFWAGCRRWFWPFVRLGLLGMVVLAGLLVGGLLVVSGLAPLVGSGAALLAAGWLAVVNGWLELARAGMVVQKDPRVAGALGRATRQALSVPVAALGSWLGLGLIGAGLLTAQGMVGPADGAADESDLGGLLAWLVVGQGLQFVGAWLKGVRLGAAVGLVRAGAASSNAV